MNLLAWLVPWEPSPTVVLCFVLTTGLYLRGAVRSPMTAPWPRQLAFWLGLAVIYIGLHTRLDYYAEHEFFVHRLQHLALHHLGPFLIALAYPGATLRRGLPLRWRTHVLVPLRNSLPVRWALNFLLNPVVAALLFFGLIYFWLWPAVHFDAMLDWRLYRVMNWSMTIDGLMFWWLILDSRPRPPARVAPGFRVAIVIAVMFPEILIGAYITFSQHDLYPIYALCGRAFGGITQATDQALGGLIVWIPSAMMSVIGALLAFRNWLKLSTRRQRVIERGEDTRQRVRHAIRPDVATNGLTSTVPR